MVTDMILSKFYGVSPKYKNMLEDIKREYPALKKTSQNFYKTQSQFMDNMFTVHQPTKLRSLRQILAEIENAKSALSEAYFTHKKKEIELNRKRHDLLHTINEFDRQLLEVEIEEILNGLESGKSYINAAIRRVHAYISQYNRILEKLGKTEFTEEDFEIDECRYHVMTAFDQGLCAARAHGGVIDEGNHIYFYQIGVSGTAAQQEVSKFLQSEGQMLQQGIMPDHKHTTDWLEAMGNKYAGNPIEFAIRKGMIIINKESLHDNGI